MGRRLKFVPAGFVDLQSIVKEHDIDDISLQKIYALLFSKKISKSQRLSNWEAEMLTESQKKYAALDAWACLKIYEKLCPTKKYT
jgi:ribonuclease D